MQRQPQNLCCVPRILASLPNIQEALNPKPLNPTLCNMPQAKTEVCAAIFGMLRCRSCTATFACLQCGSDLNNFDQKLRCRRKMQRNIDKVELQESGACLPLSCGFQAPMFRPPGLGPAETCVSSHFGPRGTKTTVFSGDFGPRKQKRGFQGFRSAVEPKLRCGSAVEPKLLYFQGMLVCCGTKTAQFFKDVGPLWNQNCCIFQGFGSSLNQHVFSRNFGPRQGAHAWAICGFNSSRQNKSAWRNFLLIRNRARKQNVRNVIFYLFLNSWPKQKVWVSNSFGGNGTYLSQNISVCNRRWTTSLYLWPRHDQKTREGCGGPTFLESVFR